MLALFPGGARIVGGVLELDGLAATELAERFGTPLVVYSEAALRERARMFQRAVPDALVVYGTKAFPNVALMRLLGEEGIGADVSTLGELAFARRAGIPGERLLVHVRVTPGVEAETHEAIRTGHRGSKFGLDEDDAFEAVRTALAAGLDVEGLHVHVGSQLADERAHLLAVALLAQFADRCRSELEWTPRVIDVGGGFGIRHVQAELEPPVEELVRTVAAAVSRDWVMRGLQPPRLIVEPGRAPLGPAAVPL